MEQRTKRRGLILPTAAEDAAIDASIAQDVDTMELATKPGHLPNEVIDLAEKNSQEVARFSLAGLDEARRRANVLLVLLLAGGGAGAPA